VGGICGDSEKLHTRDDMLNGANSRATNSEQLSHVLYSFVQTEVFVSSCVNYVATEKEMQCRGVGGTEC